MLVPVWLPGFVGAVQWGWRLGSGQWTVGVAASLQVDDDAGQWRLCLGMGDFFSPLWASS